jgi:hypothetical protein
LVIGCPGYYIFEQTNTERATIMIIPEFLKLLNHWRTNFKQERTFNIAIQMAFATICQLGRNTISQRIVLLDYHKVDWNKFYRFFSRREWSLNRLFDVILQFSQEWCHDKYIVVACDDTLVHKTGTKVHNTAYLRDPLSPKFRYNLTLGLRYIQLSLLLPIYDKCCGTVRACALPIRFNLAAVVKKPRKPNNKPIPEEVQRAYEKAKSENSLPNHLADAIKELRNWLNVNNLRKKILLLVVDNGYCNTAVFSCLAKNVHLIARARCNYRVHYCDKSKESFKPEEIRKSNDIEWLNADIWFGGKKQKIRYKIVSDIFWPGGAEERKLRLIIIAGTPYKRSKNAKIQYRQPGYLLTTDLNAPIDFLIQCYFNRWQIEVNHRDEKTILGVGEAQVHTKTAVEREPGFSVAVYSLLKLATLLACGPLRTDQFFELPKWYTGANTPSLEDMQHKLRKEAWEHPDLLSQYNICITPQAIVTATRA